MNGGAEDDAGSAFFSPPQFKPAEALVQLRRLLRGLGGLGERGDLFEWKGRPMVAFAVDGATLAVRLAKRPAVSPEWETRTLKSSADLRKLGDEVKQRVARWKDADE